MLAFAIQRGHNNIRSHNEEHESLQVMGNMITVDVLIFSSVDMWGYRRQIHSFPVCI